MWDTLTKLPNLPYTGKEKAYGIYYEDFILEQI